MYKYILVQEKLVLEKLNSKDTDINYKELLEYHNRQILWLQHERLIHLIITIITAILFIAIGAIMLFTNNIIVNMLFLTITIVMIFYIIHYCRLENTVQRWYVISNDIYIKRKG